MNSSSAATDFVQEWTLAFHGTDYIVTVTSSDALLSVEVEDEDSGDRWSAEFTSQYVEEITHKAGNFKKFPLFVKMLSSALAKSSDSVFVDLLTFADLEVLKARKTGQPSSSFSSSTTASPHRQGQKRYIILTYTGEFDRVHYPLPLPYEDTPNAAALQRAVKRLRNKLRAAEPASEKERELRQLVTALRQENTELRHRLRHAKEAVESHAHHLPATASPRGPSTSTSTSATRERENERRLRQQVEELSKQLTQTSQTLEQTRRDAARKEMRELRLKVQRLEQELRAERLARGRPTHQSNHHSVVAAAPGGGGGGGRGYGNSRTSSPRARSASPATNSTRSPALHNSYHSHSHRLRKATNTATLRSDSPASVSSRASSQGSARGSVRSTGSNNSATKKTTTKKHSTTTTTSSSSTSSAVLNGAGRDERTRHERSPSRLRGSRQSSYHYDGRDDGSDLPPRRQAVVASSSSASRRLNTTEEVADWIPPAPPRVRSNLSTASSVSGVTTTMVPVKVRAVAGAGAVEGEQVAVAQSVRQSLEGLLPPRSSAAAPTSAQGDHLAAKQHLRGPPASREETKQEEEDIAAIDRRIQALQAYLDNAR
eukprot:gene9471-10461_t